MKTLIALVALLMPTVSAAQTAEETIAFLVAGLEDGVRNQPTFCAAGKTGMECNRRTITKMAGSEWSVLLENQRGERIGTFSLQVRRLDGCKYLVRQKTLDGTTDQFLYDFSQFQRYEPFAKPRETYMIVYGTRTFAKKGADYQSGGFTWGPFSEPERFAKALSYFQSVFCKGRAF